MLVTPLASTVSDNWFYAIEDAGDLLLIDPIDPAVAIAHVRKRAPKRVRILNTHGHPDHIGGLEYVLERVDAPVYIGEDDAQMLRSPGLVAARKRSISRMALLVIMARKLSPFFKP